MATFDKLVQEIDAEFRLGPRASQLVQRILDLIARQPGGIGGFLDRFKAAGFAAEVASWVGGTNAVLLSDQEVAETLGSGVISRLADKGGVSQRVASTILGYAIPKIIGQLAEGGFAHFAVPLSSSHADEIPLPGAEQIPPSRTEGGGAPRLGRLLIPGACLLLTLGLLGYAISAGRSGTRPAGQAAPVIAQKAPAAATPAPSTPARLALSNENGLSAPNQPALQLPAINFTANSAKVPSSGKALLRQAAGLIKLLPAGTVVRINGYTHNAGDPTANVKLAQRRADAVRQVLVDAGVNPTMLIAQGYGSSDSLANNNGTLEGRSNDAIESRRRNDRRVEFSIVQP